MTNETGFIMLPRSFFKSPEWRIKRTYSFTEAYLDLQLMAYYGNEPTQRVVNGCEVTLSTGQLVATHSFLAERWSWSKAQVRYWLNKMIHRSFITAVSTKRCLIVTVNQAFTKNDEATLQPLISTPVSSNNNKISKEKDDNSKVEQATTVATPPQHVTKATAPRKAKAKARCTAFVPPTVNEVEDFCREEDLRFTDAGFFVNYYESKGWRVGSASMRSWRAAARNWNRREMAFRARHGLPATAPSAALNAAPSASNVSTHLTNLFDHENNSHCSSNLAVQSVVDDAPTAHSNAYPSACAGFVPSNAPRNYGSSKADACHQALEGFAARQARYIARMDAEEPDF